MNQMKQWFQSLNKNVRVTILATILFVCILIFFVTIALLCVFSPAALAAVALVLAFTMCWSMVNDVIN